MSYADDDESMELNCAADYEPIYVPTVDEDSYDPMVLDHTRLATPAPQYNPIDTWSNWWATHTQTARAPSITKTTEVYEVADQLFSDPTFLAKVNFKDNPHATPPSVMLPERRRQHDDTPIEYIRHRYYNSRRDYDSRRDYGRPERTKDYERTRDYDRTKDYERTRTTDYDRPKDYQRTKDYDRQKDYQRTRDYDRQKDYQRTRDYDRQKDYQRTKDYDKSDRPRNQMATFFDSYYKLYKKHMKHHDQPLTQHMMLQILFDWLSGDVVSFCVGDRQHNIVLELGCGVSDGVYNCVPNLLHYVGLDNSKTAIDESLPCPGRHFIEHDICSGPRVCKQPKEIISSKMFDVITCTNLVQYMFYRQANVDRLFETADYYANPSCGVFVGTTIDAAKMVKMIMTSQAGGELPLGWSYEWTNIKDQGFLEIHHHLAAFRFHTRDVIRLCETKTLAECGFRYDFKLTDGVMSWHPNYLSPFEVMINTACLKYNFVLKSWTSAQSWFWERRANITTDCLAAATAVSTFPEDPLWSYLYIFGVFVFAK